MGDPAYYLGPARYEPKVKRTRFCVACGDVAVSKRDKAGQLCKWCLLKVNKQCHHEGEGICDSCQRKLASFKHPKPTMRLAKHRTNTYHYQHGAGATLGVRDTD